MLHHLSASVNNLEMTLIHTSMQTEVQTAQFPELLHINYTFLFRSLHLTGAEDLPVQSSQPVRIATAVFPSLSLLNHSCCPNTSLVFNNADPCTSDQFADLSEAVSEERSAACGVTVTIRAAKVITPGQEILHCYGKKRRHSGKSNEGREGCEGADIFHKTEAVCISSDITVLLLSTCSVAQFLPFSGPHSRRMATQERQRLLQEQYYFLCQCEACTLQTQKEEGDEGRECWSGLHESGFLCGKCKGSLKVIVD